MKQFPQIGDVVEVIGGPFDGQQGILNSFDWRQGKAVIALGVDVSIRVSIQEKISARLPGFPEIVTPGSTALKVIWRRN